MSDRPVTATNKRDRSPPTKDEGRDRGNGEGDETTQSTSNNTNIIDVRQFCTVSVPDFTPLGGSRPDAAVVACVAVWEQEEEEAKEDVILPPDVLDTALAMLCAPLIVRHAGDLRGREAHFQCHTATVRMHTTDEDAEDGLRRMSADMPRGGLSVTVVLGETVTELRDSFMLGINDGGPFLAGKFKALGRIDLRWTSLRKIGSNFLCGCESLTTVTLPPSLTEVGNCFLAYCDSLQRVDMGHTALHTVGELFAGYCFRLTTLVLPDTVTRARVGIYFLHGCNPVEVTRRSTAVQAAVSEHNTCG